MRSLLRIIYGATLVALAACGKVAGSSAHPAPEHDVLTRQEIMASTASTGDLLQAIQSLRPNFLAVHPSAHVKTLAQLVDLSKKTDVSYSSPGVGSASHFACEFFRAQAGAKMQNIPFKGSEYVTELLSGRVQFACPPIGLVAEYFKNGQLVPVAVSSVKRVPSLPDVPTAIEQGFPRFDYTIWYGVVASSKTPRAIVDQLAAELSAIDKAPDVIATLGKQGISPRDMEGSRFDAFIKSEIVKLHEVAEASGVKPQ